MPQKILVVDDESSMQSLMRTFLTKAGYETATAGSAEDGLAILKEGDYDVVLADFMLPGADGLELTRRIKSSYDADVILITGRADLSYEDAVHQGATDFIIKPIRLEELVLRVKRVLSERELRRERADMMAKLTELATQDELTGLFNRRKFDRELQDEIARAARYGRALSLMFLDLDCFKAFNDTHGHQRGDEALTMLGTVINRLLRKSDQAFRYGGEEFAILLPETTSDSALTLAERLRQETEETSFASAEGKKLTITVSIGVTQYVGDETAESFVGRADAAMYRSKTAGRNRVTVLGGGGPSTLVSSISTS